MAKKQTMDHAQLLVLSLLAGEDMYGYQMIVELSRRSDHTFEMKEGTLYPVLRRLQKEQCLETYDLAIDGRNRRYYRLTETGRLQLALYKGEWAAYSRNISRIFEEAKV